jgi:hypothetical protein
MMVIQVELTPEDEARLRERAQARGAAPEALAGEMLHALLHQPVNGNSAKFLPVLDEQGVFHRERWEAVLASIERRSKGTPVLPAEALTREAMYHDHD